MTEMSLDEAQLFRILGGFFGRERVVWNMSVRAVCGGEFSDANADFSWAEAATCLFTIVDEDDAPKMVVEFALNLKGTIDLQLLERQSRLPKLLESLGIRYIMLTASEFNEILDPGSSLDLVSLLEDRLGLMGDDDGEIEV
jgi:hypothetical protein